MKNKEKIILENFVKIFNKIKRVNESELDEISTDMRQRAIDSMKNKGQERRADKWTQHYGTKDLKKFEETEFELNERKSIIYAFKINGDSLDISYGSPRNQQFNNHSGSLEYIISADKYRGEDRMRMPRKTARLFALIASTVNPNTKFKSGTGEFKINNY